MKEYFVDLHDWPRHLVTYGSAQHWHYLAPLGFGYCFIFDDAPGRCKNPEPGDFHDC